MKEITELLGKHKITLEFEENPHDESYLSLYVSAKPEMPLDIIEILKKEYKGKSGRIFVGDESTDHIVVEIVLSPVEEKDGKKEADEK